MSSRGRNFNLRTDVGNNFPSVHHLPNQPLRFFWKILRNFGKYWERFGNSLPLVNHLPVCLGIILNLSNQLNCSFENMNFHSDNPWTVFPASRPVSFVCASRKMTVNLVLHQACHKSLQPGQRQRPISAQSRQPCTALLHIQLLLYAAEHWVTAALCCCTFLPATQLHCCRLQSISNIHCIAFWELSQVWLQCGCGGKEQVLMYLCLCVFVFVYLCIFVYNCSADVRSDSVQTRPQFPIPEISEDAVSVCRVLP